MKREARATTATGPGRRPAFVTGLLLGLGLSLGAFATAAVAADKDLSNFTRGLLYAITQLAVDTESNAEKIVDLSERIDQLEITLEKLQPKQE